MFCKTWLVAFAAALMISSGANAVDIEDTFEVDSSGSYIVRTDSDGAPGDGLFDGTVAFAYDYVAAGLPLAPNSAPGAGKGIRFTVNDTEEGPEGPTTTEEDHVTAFLNVPVTAAQYRVDVDMYMLVNTGASGTTEFGHFGVGGTGATFNSIFTPIAGSGHFVAITGEGGSASDYRHYVDGGLVVPSGDASYLNSANTTNATGDTYQSIFPSTEFPGSPGNSWATLSIVVDAANVTYLINDTPIIRTPKVATNGLVSIGYTDAFDSVGPHAVIFDNLRVTLVPEPASALLGLVGLAAVASRRRR
ncbi:PEP-CTERM sorting domain-containing protein [Botrimarina hoheduenensis]|uniref:Ice-binding protein C-terminal domain-containing protein n=1 Tax=Botrimarina hoheduenensis TaxID=2528000 RepID=A0A5C5WFM0_9BACT|nr:PEP-CTERM sorting domain-containing protein [Botrimarina hoheduenensis]TWT48901.1 hypothetical protein Pla111_06770 [Botrimarina hoheduenensis]